MTDIVADIESAFARVEAHIKTLLDGGAPHQQAHAQDLKTVLATAKGAPAVADINTTELDNLKAQVATLQTELETANGKLATLQGNIDNLLAVRDSLQTQLDKAIADLKTANDTVALQDTELTELKAELATAKSPLSAAAKPVGGRIASTDAASIGNKTQPE